MRYVSEALERAKLDAKRQLHTFRADAKAAERSAVGEGAAARAAEEGEDHGGSQGGTPGHLLREEHGAVPERVGGVAREERAPREPPRAPRRGGEAEEGGGEPAAPPGGPRGLRPPPRRGLRRQARGAAFQPLRRRGPRAAEAHEHARARDWLRGWPARHGHGNVEGSLRRAREGDEVGQVAVGPGPGKALEARRLR